ncbi:DUF2742 domain-containing protein [Mycolicibacterium neoaurum]|uniref:DUF2742 domain-containing protein n=1 Tax=Mycolicibacterium neoaurum TaxID=1795 RepID=UPI001F4CDE42|nr:DUF2742 domain-containing protein [Mycolicibacterium neoaurum]
MSSAEEAAPAARRSGGSPSSQQRSWWEVHQFIEAVVQQANYGPIPAAGTPAWTELADGDPRKLLAVAIDGEHWTLRVETSQIAMAQASHEIAAATDWSAVAKNLRRRGPYIERKAS